MMSGDLHMAQLSLDQPSLFRTARDHGWSRRGVDDFGHLIHHQLKALLNGLAPRPFRTIGQRRRWMTVLGYTTVDAVALRRRATEHALPADLQAVRLDAVATKPIPPFETGRRLGFELRACPVARLSSERVVERRNGEKLRYRQGAEIDLFLHRRDVRGESTTRESVYLTWLRERLAGSAELTRAEVASYRRVRTLRRIRAANGGREPRTPERPDVLFRGELTVQDRDRFRSLLGKGVGRHKAFGFGMLLLRPAD